MANAIKAIRGMNDVLPEQQVYWQHLEKSYQQILHQYGYQEIRFPVLEQTALFKRSVGESTDIIEKEMYTFEDRNGDSLSLRPEGTACCVRAGIEHGLLYNQIQRLWYHGPMFRHERPQKGRYRQFHQLGIEAFGMPGVAIECEQIAMIWRLWQLLGIEDQVVLELNNLGSPASRQHYREKLVHYFERYQADLDEDARRRLQTNPMRLLDSKNPAMQPLIADAPLLPECLSADEQAHHAALIESLQALSIPFQLNPRLVRGLDYYNLTVYEWTTQALGAQGTLCAGGRYDGLVEQLGGKSTPAVGCAMGLERLILMLVDQQTLQSSADVYWVSLGECAQQASLVWVEQLRARLPHLKVIMDCVPGAGMKSQLKRADKSRASHAVIVAEDEVAGNFVSLKNLRDRSDQVKCNMDELITQLED